MNTTDAIKALSALAQETRLEAYRRLVQAGAEGHTAGELATALGVPAPTLSFHLTQLTGAGLIISRRAGRVIHYAADLDRMTAVLAYLTENCCGSGCSAMTHVYDPNAPGGCGAPQPETVPMSTPITIYHNPACGTSRNTLALIRNSGVEPVVIEYLKTPPSREELVDLIRRMGIPVRDLLRRKGTPYDDLGLDTPALTDDQLIDAMMAHPILINRPIVVTPLGVKLCRPSEAVLDILADPQRGAFTKEDGERVIDENGNRLI